MAVLDNGVQTSHPLLQGTVVAEACYSTPNPWAGEYSMCPGRVTASTASGSASYCYDANYGNSAQVNEDAGMVTLWVQRLGSASASASVRYATSNGTARSGSDYVSKSGTLNWAAGDANPKAITISIVNNTTKEATEAFYVTLSSPKGATLGTISRATVSVTDND